MRALSPITYASPTSPPHIFVHGAEDRLVPPQQSRTMHEALTREGVRSELFEVAGRDHAMPPEDSEEMHRTLDFLLECPVGKETAP
jgi:dipeptidyl aminopeptidase/acylaminoacyl peptidase